MQFPDPLKGFFCDIDDTLTHDGVLVPKAYAALCRAKEKGLRVVPVTGRPLGWAEVLVSTWPVDAVIAENGAVAVRIGGGRKLDHLYFASPPDATDAARAQVIANVRARVPKVLLAQDQWLRRCDVAFDIGETVHLPASTVEEIGHAIVDAGATFTHSSVHAHAALAGWTKAKMCERLAAWLWQESLPDTRERYFFVGDSMNDESAFAYFPLSFGVANVRKYATELASRNAFPRFVANQEGGHGFAEILETLDKPL